MWKPDHALLSPMAAPAVRPRRQQASPAVAFVADAPEGLLDYAPERVHRYLMHLPEIRALLTTSSNLRHDTVRRERLRGAFLCILWELEDAIRLLPADLREAIF